MFVVELVVYAWIMKHCVRSVHFSIANVTSWLLEDDLNHSETARGRYLKFTLRQTLKSEVEEMVYAQHGLNVHLIQSWKHETSTIYLHWFKRTNTDCYLWTVHNTCSHRIVHSVETKDDQEFPSNESDQYPFA